MLTYVSATGHVMPKPSRPRPAWATALRVRRAELGKSQEQVALDSGILNQTTVSELEGGRYDLANLTAARLAGLSRGLDWTLAEMEAALEVDFGLGLYESTPPTRPGPPIPPVVPHRETPVVIPLELQQVIDEHGGTYPELRDPTIQKIIAAPRNFGGPDNGPQTAQDWLEYFLVTRRYLR